MELTNQQFQQISQPPIHWGHFGAVFFTIVLLVSISWFKQPQLFSFKKNSIATADANAPRYYAYVAPPEDQPGPMVAGARTNPGPMVIQDDGTVVPVDMEQVLGASTEGVVLTLDDVKVNAIPESLQAVQKYFTEVQNIEAKSIEIGEFETALSSNNQQLIDRQAEKLTGIKNNLESMSVPQGLVKLHKLKIIQYNAATGVLRNFTQADSNPELVGKYLQEFLKSQQDLDTENKATAEKYGELNPMSAAYLEIQNQPAP